MDFSTIQILDKGVTRKSTAGTTKESSFDVKFTNYTRVSEKGNEVIKHFVFSKGAMTKTNLGSVELAASPFVDEVNGVVGIVVVPASKGNFFVPSKRSPNAKKANSVTVPTLVKSLAEHGMLDTDFQGSQHFDLVELGRNEEMVAYKLVKSETVADRPYEPNVTEQEVANEAENDANY